MVDPFTGRSRRGSREAGKKAAATRAANRAARQRLDSAIRVSRGVPDIPDGRIVHAVGCFLARLHLGDCLIDPRSGSRSGDHIPATIGDSVTETAPTKEARP